MVNPSVTTKKIQKNTVKISLKELNCYTRNKTLDAK